MVRDRLSELRSRVLRDGHDEVAFVVDVEPSSGGFLAEFFAEVQDISDHIERIEIKVNDVKKLHSVIISAPQEDARTKNELENTMSSIKQSVEKVRRKLRLIEESLKKDESLKDSAEYRIRKIQHATLSQKFLKAMEEYNNAQEVYRTRCKDRIQRQLQITGRSVTNEEIEDMLETGNPSVFVQGIVVETQKAKQSLADIEARHGDIIKLEQSIRELHEMFLDMALMVQNQGELIDRIETQVESSKDYVATARKNATHAANLKVKARKKKIILIVVVVVILIIIALLIYFSL